MERTTYRNEVSRKADPQPYERRRSRRYRFRWPAYIIGINGEGLLFRETSVLQNLSPHGALISLAAPLKIGAQMVICIKTPFKVKKWIKYRATVVRIDSASSNVGLEFDTCHPVFFD